MYGKQKTVGREEKTDKETFPLERATVESGLNILE